MTTETDRTVNDLRETISEFLDREKLEDFKPSPTATAEYHKVSLEYELDLTTAQTLCMLADFLSVSAAQAAIRGNDRRCMSFIDCVLFVSVKFGEKAGYPEAKIRSLLKELLPEKIATSAKLLARDDARYALALLKDKGLFP